MTADDAPAFATAYAKLRSATRAAAHQHDDLDQSDTMAAYFEALSSHDVGHVQAAAHAIALRSPWFPAIAEWRQAAQAEAARASADAPLRVTIRQNATPADVAALQSARAGLTQALHRLGHDSAAAAFTGPLQVPAPDYCGTCKDSGWHARTCGAGARCGRPSCEGSEREHEYVSRCACRDRNPNFQRRLQQMVRRTAPS